MPVRTGSLLLAALVLACGAVRSGGGTPARFHADPEETAAAAQAAARAIWADDMPAARAAFDRLERGCRRLMPEERASYGESVVNADRMYHLALSSAREHSGAGESDAAFEDYVGLLTVCRGCHRLAREGAEAVGERPMTEGESPTP